MRLWSRLPNYLKQWLTKIKSHLIPLRDAVYNIGSAAKKWNKGWLVLLIVGSIAVTTLGGGGQSIQMNDSINLMGNDMFNGTDIYDIDRINGTRFNASDGYYGRDAQIDESVNTTKLKVTDRASIAHLLLTGNFNYTGTNPMRVYCGDTAGDDCLIFANPGNPNTYIWMLGGGTLSLGVEYGQSVSMEEGGGTFAYFDTILTNLESNLTVQDNITTPQNVSALNVVTKNSVGANTTKSNSAANISGSLWLKKLKVVSDAKCEIIIPDRSTCLTNCSQINRGCLFAYDITDVASPLKNCTNAITIGSCLCC